MAKPQYRHAHQQERERLRPTVEAGEAYCVEPICLMTTRWIAPESKWHVSHDPTGTITLGPSHERCNTSEGARRGNRTRGKPKPPVVKRAPTANRWQL